MILQNEWVRLEPLTLEHVSGLAQVGADADVWRWLPVAQPRSIDEVRSLIGEALAQQADGLRLPFVVVVDGVTVGTTSLLDLAPAHLSAEIGWTWYGRTARRTAANTASKRLLLEYCFEVLGVRRVTFKTDTRNEASNAALLRIGATYEGTLRSHRVLPGGGRRDSAYYSMLDIEWSAARARLDGLLGASATDAVDEAARAQVRPHFDARIDGPATGASETPPKASR